MPAGFGWREGRKKVPPARSRGGRRRHLVLHEEPASSSRGGVAEGKGEELWREAPPTSLEEGGVVEGMGEEVAGVGGSRAWGGRERT